MTVLPVLDNEEKKKNDSPTVERLMLATDFSVNSVKVEESIEPTRAKAAKTAIFVGVNISMI